MAVMDVKRLIPASRLDMYDVVNTQGEDMGQVQNFMVDPDTGRIAFIIVSFGGILGLSDKWIAMPLEILAWNDTDRRFVLDLPRETLENAPGIDKDKWPYEFNLDWLDSVYTCFNCQPYWGSGARWGLKEGETFIVSAVWLKGRMVKNAAGEEIGKINDLVIDLQSGYLTYALVDIMGIEAIKGKQAAIPIEAFRVNPNTMTITLDVDRMKLENAPVFGASQIMLDRDSVGRVYTYYGYTPYWDNRMVWRRRGSPVHMGEPSTSYRPDLYMVSDLIGNSVRDAMDKDVGKLDDLMIDLQSGYLASAIIEAGGIMEMKDKFYPMPLEVVSFDPMKKRFYLSVDKDILMEAPAFDRDRLPRIDRQGLIDIYDAYGYTPYWREKKPMPARMEQKQEMQ